MSSVRFLLPPQTASGREQSTAAGAAGTNDGQRETFGQAPRISAASAAPWLMGSPGTRHTHGVEGRYTCVVDYGHLPFPADRRWDGRAWDDERGIVAFDGSRDTAAEMLEWAM